MSYPTNTSASDVWSIRDVYKARAGDSWPFPPPIAPTTVTATDEDDSESTVSFSGQVTYGISPTFTVISSPDGITATGSSSPITVTGLTNDTEYTFKVTVDDDGGSATSDPSNAVTPESSSGVVTDSNLFLYLDMANSSSYSGSGSTWSDISGNGNNVSITQGSPSYTTADGGAWEFSLGSVDRIASTSSSSDFDISQGNFTYEIWMKMTTAGDSTNAYYHLFHIGDSEGSGSSYYMRQWRSGINPGGIYTRINNSTALGYGKYIKLSGEGWLQVTHVEDNGTLSLYLNGNLEESISTPAYPSSGSQFITLGNAGLGSFDGSMSIIRIYQRPLSVSEIQQNFNADRVRFGI